MGDRLSESLKGTEESYRRSVRDGRISNGGDRAQFYSWKARQPKPLAKQRMSIWLGKKEPGPRFELGLLDSKSKVLTITPTRHACRGLNVIYYNHHIQFSN